MNDNSDVNSRRHHEADERSPSSKDMEESQVTKKLKSVTVATHMAAARERHIQIKLEDLEKQKKDGKIDAFFMLQNYKKLSK
jgi:hypothetical protein